MKHFLLLTMIMFSSLTFAGAEVPEGIEVCGQEVSYNAEDITVAQIQETEVEIYNNLESKIEPYKNATYITEPSLDRRYETQPENEFREVLVVYEKACVTVIE